MDYFLSSAWYMQPYLVNTWSDVLVVYLRNVKPMRHRRGKSLRLFVKEISGYYRTSYRAKQWPLKISSLWKVPPLQSQSIDKKFEMIEAPSMANVPCRQPCSFCQSANILRDRSSVGQWQHGAITLRLKLKCQNHQELGHLKFTCQRENHWNVRNQNT